MRIPLLLLLSFLACTRRVGNAQGGDRVSIRSIALPNGEEVALSLYDARLRAPCTFSSIGGQYRCVPGGAAVVYKDDLCTQPMALEDRDARCQASLGDQIFATETVRQGCETRVRIFRVGIGSPSPAVLYTKLLDGTCVSRGGGSIGETAYELGQPLDPGELLAANATTAFDVVARVGFRETIIASDGTRVDGVSLGGELFDHMLQTPCTPATADDGSLRCLPTGAAIDPATFANATCDAPVMSINREAACGADPPRFAGRTAQDACATATTTLFRTDAEIEDVYGGEACTLLPKDTKTARYALSTPVSAGDFVALSLAKSIEGQRLTTRYYVTDDKRRVRFESIFDNELQIACRPVTLGEDDVRCAPHPDTRTRLAYLDDDCRQPVIARQKSCATQAVSAFATRAGTDATSSCPTLSIYKAGAARAASPTALFADVGGICTPLPMLEDLDLFDAEPTGLDTFAKLSVR